MLLTILKNVFNWPMWGSNWQFWDEESYAPPPNPARCPTIFCFTLEKQSFFLRNIVFMLIGKTLLLWFLYELRNYRCLNVHNFHIDRYNPHQQKFSLISSKSVKSVKDPKMRYRESKWRHHSSFPCGVRTKLSADRPATLPPSMYHPLSQGLKAWELIS